MSLLIKDMILCRKLHPNDIKPKSETTKSVQPCFRKQNKHVKKNTDERYQESILKEAKLC